ncbi:MAG: right-handed parallel beta-helix repeat-containing protein [Terracidiphilus sp.]
MKKVLVAFFAFVALSVCAQAKTFHVSIKGDNANSGSEAAPFRTIQHAADLSQPGDVIRVHAGVYRERVSPPRGGTSDTKRSFNPYSDLIHGDWFNPMGRKHHTGAVYLDGNWLTEADSRDDVMKPMGSEALWFGEVDGENTTIWAQFKGTDPNRQRVEINVRQTVFYPEKTGIDYITVHGFTLEDAATPWAPPTAEQIGVIGPHWSKGWIIEDNVIRNSICSGISLGKYGDMWDNTSANSAEGYVKTIQRALADGWSKETVGHHIVRGNTIYECGQTGIVGSLGAAFSSITGNTIHDVHVRRTFGGAEIAGIKFHGAIDVEIDRNQIYRTPLGLWLDWMAQGTHVSRNLFHDNDADVFVEVDHGPFLIDNNLLLSSLSLTDNSQGGAFAHNLLAGTVRVNAYDSRQTPFLKAHSTAVAGFHDNPRGDDRFYNNVLVQRANLSGYDASPLPMWMDGNVYLDGAKPSKFDGHTVAAPDFDPRLQLVSEPSGLYLEMRFDKKWIDQQVRKLVTTAFLGKAVIPDLPYEQPDGKPIRIDKDYLGKSRSESNPTPGPFENPGTGDLRLKVW